ncbi:MAG: hypothetical protein IPQ13_01265 [Holophagaceae bacterium]|nr:hypothetical protein [Holophagaceae bacterium]
MSWPLPPAIEWPKFLRLLRNPAPPVGWLEAASELEDLQKRPLLLRWIAQHPKAPAQLRARLMPRLPWRILAAVAADASAHPQARNFATERLLNLWPGLTLGERRALAPMAPKQLWPLVWKVPDGKVIQAFLQNPRLHESGLLALFHAPLQPAQLWALEKSIWREQESIAIRILQLIDATLRMPEPQVVLGHAAHWIKVLEPEARLLASTGLRHPALRRMARVHVDAAMEESGL